MINKRLKAISLFSGAMGLDLGIEKAGIEIKLCVELNKQAVATIRNNTDIPVIDRDITTIPTTELLEVSGLLKTYVPNWEDKTLVGKELWDFISENENYHTILIESIDSVANTTLQNVSIVQKIEDKIAELIEVFHTNYNSLSEYYESLW